MTVHTDDLTPDTERLTNRDGCDCPTWVVRCAHFEDSHLRMLSWRSHPEQATFVRDWHVCSEPEVCDGRGPLSTSLHSGNDYDAALAAFYEAERRLLDGAI